MTPTESAERSAVQTAGKQSRYDAVLDFQAAALTAIKNSNTTLFSAKEQNYSFAELNYNMHWWLSAVTSNGSMVTFWRHDLHCRSTENIHSTFSFCLTGRDNQS